MRFYRIILQVLDISKKLSWRRSFLLVRSIIVYLLRNNCFVFLNLVFFFFVLFLLFLMFYSKWGKRLTFMINSLTIIVTVYILWVLNRILWLRYNNLIVILIINLISTVLQIYNFYRLLFCIVLFIFLRNILCSFSTINRLTFPKMWI